MVYFDNNLDGSVLVSTGDLLEAKELSSKIYAIEQKLIARVDYILKFWLGKFDCEIDTWFFDDAEEGEMGSVFKNMDDQNIHSFTLQVLDGKKIKHLQYVDGNGEIHVWNGQIPKKWLFQGFEHEVTSGKYLYDKRAQNLAKSAKAKLTPDELDALLKCSEIKPNKAHQDDVLEELE